MSRGFLLGLSSAALAIAAHGVAGGGVPNTAVTTVLAVLVAWAGTAVADRRHGTATMLALLGGSQFTLHLLLSDHVGYRAVEVDGRLMTAAHVAATLVTAVLLTRATAALGIVVAALLGIVRALAPRLPAPAAPVRPLPAAHHADHLLTVLLRVVCGRRGPPVTW